MVFLTVTVGSALTDEQTKKGYNSAMFTDIKLKFGVVVAESHPAETDLWHGRWRATCIYCGVVGGMISVADRLSPLRQTCDSFLCWIKNISAA